VRGVAAAPDKPFRVRGVAAALPKPGKCAAPQRQAATATDGGAQQRRRAEALSLALRCWRRSGASRPFERQRSWALVFRTGPPDLFFLFCVCLECFFAVFPAPSGGGGARGPWRQDGPHKMFTARRLFPLVSGAAVWGGWGFSISLRRRLPWFFFLLFFSSSPRSSRAGRGQSKAANGPRGSTGPRRTRLVYKRVWQEVGETAARAAASVASSARGRRALCAAPPQSLSWLNV
jgi:hypothetical protein